MCFARLPEATRFFLQVSIDSSPTDLNPSYYLHYLSGCFARHEPVVQLLGGKIGKERRGEQTILTADQL